MPQSSIQLDPVTKRLMADLAEWWGFPENRNTTAVIRRLVTEAHARESARYIPFDGAQDRLREARPELVSS